MIIHTKGFATSTGGDENFAYMYCTDASGYCLSLSRFLDDELVEVMVVDQNNHKTRKVSVELSPNKLRVTLSAAAAACLDGITEYIVPHTLSENELSELDAALSVIFEGGNRGRYVRYTESGSQTGRWVPCNSRNDLIARLPLNACELLVTDSPNSWGYMIFESDTVIPIGYANVGLLPSAVRHGDRIFVGIDELLVGYEISSRLCLFKYKMPTVFHEFVRFDRNELIVRDEIGFVGVSYAGVERWNFCIDLIAGYEISQSIISGKTEGGEEFQFVIPA